MKSSISHMCSPPNLKSLHRKSQIYLPNTFEVDQASPPWSLPAAHAAVFSIPVASSQCPDFYPCPLRFVLKPEAIELCLKHKSEPLPCLIPSLLTWSNHQSCHWTAQSPCPGPCRPCSITAQPSWHPCSSPDAPGKLCDLTVSSACSASRASP